MNCCVSAVTQNSLKGAPYWKGKNPHITCPALTASEGLKGRCWMWCFWHLRGKNFLFSHMTMRPAASLAHRHPLKASLCVIQLPVLVAFLAAGKINPQCQTAGSCLHGSVWISWDYFIYVGYFTRLLVTEGRPLASAARIQGDFCFQHWRRRMTEMPNIPLNSSFTKKSVQPLWAGLVNEKLNSVGVSSTLSNLNKRGSLTSLKWCLYLICIEAQMLWPFPCFCRRDLV